MLSYADARDLMSRCRDKSKGKPLQNNTRLYDCGTWGNSGLPYYAVRLHNTHVVEIYPNGTYGVRHGGWTTNTTRDRIYTYSPLTWRQLQSNGGDWHLRVRAVAGDPEPSECNHIEVTKPYGKPRDPGPEPHSEDFGTCWAGQRSSTTQRESSLLHLGDRLERGDRLSFYYPERWENAPNRARSVTEFLRQAFDGSYVRVSRLVTITTDWGEESWRHSYDNYGKKLPTYKQCEHCGKYKSALYEWTSAKQRWDVWHDRVEHYGSFEGWRSAWREDRQRVVDANRRWRAWNERNRIPFDGLVRINGEGYPLWSEVKAVRSAMSARRRVEIRERRRREAIERERRQVERFKASVRRRRRPSFNAQAAEVARTLAEMREGLEVSVSINDSQE